MGIFAPALTQQKIGALYAMAFTIKMASKFAGRDYAVCKLEGQYEAGACGADFMKTPKDEWRWKLMIRTPDFIAAKKFEPQRPIWTLKARKATSIR
jgi:hypothetical protein